MSIADFIRQDSHLAQVLLGKMKAEGLGTRSRLLASNLYVTASAFHGANPHLTLTSEQSLGLIGDVSGQTPEYEVEEPDPRHLR